MKNYKILMILLALAIGAWACGGDDPEDDPILSKDYVRVDPNAELLGDGQASEITVTSNCDWTITKDQDWISVNPSTGNGTRIISISAGKNTTGSQRIAILTVKGGNAPSPARCKVTQAKASDSPSEPSEPTTPDTPKEPGADDNQPPS